MSDLLKSVVDRSPNKWKPILKHPSLWNFSLPITCVDWVHMYLKNNELFETVDQYFYDCKSKVPTHTPLGTFLSSNPYKSIPIELFHFTRNFLNHYLDKYTITGSLYIHLTCIFTMPNSISYIRCPISYTPFPILAKPVIFFIICVLF